jgi:hypothetical protein
MNYFGTTFSPLQLQSLDLDLNKSIDQILLWGIEYWLYQANRSKV